MSDSDPNIIYGGDFEERTNYASAGEMILSNLKEGGDKVALINGEYNKVWTFSDFYNESVRMAKVFHSMGIRRNDVLSIISENKHEYMSIALGAFYINAKVAPVNTTYTERELTHTLGISKPKIVFVSASAFNVIPTLEGLNFIKTIVLIDNEKLESKSELIYLSDLIQKHQNNDFDVEEYVRKPVDLNQQGALIFMSSGTTGLPKGVELSHANLIACVANSNERATLAKMVFGEMVTFLIGPYFHAMGFMGTLLSINTKVHAQVFIVGFEPRLYLDCIQKYKVMLISVPPPVVIFLAKTPLLDEYDLSSLRFIMCGAAPLSLETENQVKARFKQEIILFQGYGQTEATLGVLYGTLIGAKSGSVGNVVRGTKAKVIDANGNSLGPNKVGELCFKGGFVMKGYVGNSQATAETIDKDGWLHTGDVGYYDEDLQFFIVDRIKELIKYKGYQVAPAELEGLLLSNPKIKDCGVIGIQDENAGELPFAFVVKQPDANITEQEVKDFVAKNVSNAKRLRGGVKFIDEIPKNPSGKILRRELRELYKSSKAKL